MPDSQSATRSDKSLPELLAADAAPYIQNLDQIYSGLLAMAGRVRDWSSQVQAEVRKATAPEEVAALWAERETFEGRMKNMVDVISTVTEDRDEWRFKSGNQTDTIKDLHRGRDLSAERIAALENVNNNFCQEIAKLKTKLAESELDFLPHGLPTYITVTRRDAQIHMRCHKKTECPEGKRGSWWTQDTTEAYRAATRCAWGHYRKYHSTPKDPIVDLTQDQIEALRKYVDVDSMSEEFQEAIATVRRFFGWRTGTA